MKNKLNILLIVAALVMSSCATIKPGFDAIPVSVEEFLQKNGTDFDNYEISDVNADYECTEQSYGDL